MYFPPHNYLFYGDISNQPRGFLAGAAVVLLVLTPLAGTGAGLLAAVVPVIDFTPSVAGDAPVGFFSPTLLFRAGDGVVPVGFLTGAVVGVVFLTAAGAGFFATPLVWGLVVPFERRLWVVLVLDPVEVLLGAVVPGFVLLDGALLVVLALESPVVLLPVLAGVSLAWFGFASPVSSMVGCDTSSVPGLAAWLPSSPAASFTGLDSSVSIGSCTAVATPSGFISPLVLVVRLCKAGLT